MPSLIRTRSFNFVKNLVKRGHEVTVLALVTSSREQKDIEFLKSYGIRTEMVFQPKWRSFINCFKALPTLMPLQVAYCYSSKMIEKIKELIEKDKFDICHIEFIRCVYLADYLNNLPRVFDDVDCRVTYLRQLLRAKKNPFSMILTLEELFKMHYYEPSVCKKFDRVFAISWNDVTDLQSLNRILNIQLLSNGVDVSYFKPEEIKKKEKSIIFSGKMSYYPNSDAVLYFYHRIFPQIRAANPDVIFYIVGSDPPSQVVRLRKDPNVIVTGYVDDMRPYFQKASVSIVPIRIGVGVQNKVIEAMSMGLPVVATSLACEGLSIEPGKNIIRSDEPTDFAGKVNLLFNNQPLREQIGREARRYVEENHNWNVIVERLENIYKEVIDGAKG